MLLLAALAYTLLVRALLARHGSDSVLARAIGSDFKGNVSVACYVLGILLSALLSRWLGLALYTAVALIWLVPDLRIERALAERRSSPAPAVELFTGTAGAPRSYKARGRE